MPFFVGLVPSLIKEVMQTLKIGFIHPPNPLQGIVFLRPHPAVLRLNPVNILHCPAKLFESPATETRYTVQNGFGKCPQSLVITGVPQSCSTFTHRRVQIKWASKQLWRHPVTWSVPPTHRRMIFNMLFSAQCQRNPWGYPTNPAPQPPVYSRLPWPHPRPLVRPFARLSCPNRVNSPASPFDR